jgi:hypothetical protein
MQTPRETPPDAIGQTAAEEGKDVAETPATPTEIGGPQGPEPTRFGDWERKGRCIDF